MLIVKDKDGYIYGGYASQSWERHADFYGDMKSFLFQLYPKASIFRPTGANTNIQWVSVLSFVKRSMPFEVLIIKRLREPSYKSVIKHTLYMFPYNYKGE